MTEPLPEPTPTYDQLHATHLAARDRMFAHLREQYRWPTLECAADLAAWDAEFEEEK